MLRDHNASPSNPVLFWSLSVFAVTVFVFAYLVISSQWQLFAVPSMRPLFADMLAVTSAIECHSLGYDIFTENPCDPVARPYVFGRPFLWMSQLGITTGDALLLGLASALVFLVAVLLVIRPGNLLSSICSLGLVLSPAILLAIERGNSDLVVFVLLVLCLKLLTSPGLIAACVSAGVLLVLSMMKLYPIAALVGVGLYVFAVNRV